MFEGIFGKSKAAPGFSGTRRGVEANAPQKRPDVAARPVQFRLLWT